MSKFRSLILIIGLSLIAVVASLLTVLVFYSTGTIVTDPIELVYTVNSDKKFYDGTPLTLADNAYTLDSGEILEGHTAQVKVVGSQTNAGTSESTLEVKIFDKKGFDVSDEYAVKVNVGTLTVEKQKLSVMIEGSSVPYSGKRVYFNDYKILKGELAKGHKIAGVNASLLNVDDEVPDDIAPVVYDAFDNDVSANYEFLDFDIVGKIEITPRPLTIKPKDVSKVYDGTALTATEYEIVSGSLAPGQTADYSIIFTGGGEAKQVDCTDESGVFIQFYKFAILDEDGKAVDLENYELTLDRALFTIEQRPITIATATQTFTYDGEEHYNDTIQLLSGTLAPNQKISVTSYITVCPATEEPVENELTFDITFNGKPVKGNYSITNHNGTLTVKKQKLTLYTKDYTKVYDGEKLGKVIDDDEENYVLKADLDSKFILTATYSDTIKDNINVISGTYAFDEDDVHIKLDNGKEVTENFDITVREGKYSITQRSITVKPVDVSVVYDGDLHKIEDFEYIKGSLVEGHSVEVNYVKKSDNSVAESVDCIDSVVKIGSFIITADGNPVTENYYIDPIDGVLTISKRTITVKPVDVSVVYDGDLHKIEDFVCIEGSIVEWHDVAVNYVKEPDNSAAESVNCIDCAVKINSFIITADGNPVTENYYIDPIDGALTITKRPITIKTGSKSFEYDGAEHDYRDEDESIGLADKHIINKIVNTFAIVKDVVSEATNDFIFEIINIADNAPVTENYEITREWGTLTVTPRTITVKPVDVSVVYDGDLHKIDRFECIEGSIVEGHNVDVDFWDISVGAVPQSVNCIDSVVEISSFVITADGNPVTGNYDVNYIKGALTINKRPITIKTGSQTYEYDGKEHEYRGEDGSVGLLEDKHKIVPNKDSYLKVKNVADSGLNDYYFEIRNKADNSDVTDNYEITRDWGTLTVTQRALLVKTPSESFVYNGKEQYVEDGNKYIKIGLLDGDEFKIEKDGYTKVKNTADIKPNEVLNYTITNREGSVKDNYQITIDYGTLTVTKRPLTMRSPSETFEYNGSEQYVAESRCVAEGWLTSDGSVVFSNPQKVKTVTDGVSNEYRYDIYPVSADVLDNYEISTDWGTLTVTPKALTVKTGSQSFEYDGGGHDFREEDAVIGLLESKHNLVPDIGSYTVLTNVADNVLNDFNFKIRDLADNSDVTGNYEITYDWGTLTVTKRHITVKPKDVSVVYNGELHTVNDYICLDGSIVDGQDVEANYVKKSDYSSAETVNCIDSVVRIASFIITDGGDNVSSNYDIELLEGTLTVTKRPLLIKTGSLTFEYDGEEHDYRAEDEKVGLLEAKHNFIVKDGSYLKVTNVADSGLNDFDFEIRSKADNSDVEDNYEITYDWGTVTATKRPLTVKTGSKAFVYDGTAQEYRNGDEFTGLLDVKHEVVLTSAYTKVKSVEDVALNDFDFEIRNKADNSDVTENYEITRKWGTLTVTKRALTIKSASKTFTYTGFEQECTDAPEIIGLADVDFFGQDGVIITKVKNVEGNIPNFFSYEITDVIGIDVKQNYEINFIPGVLTVIQKENKITTTDATKVYDGTALTATQGTPDGLLAGHSIERIGALPSITDVGTVVNKQLFNIIDDATGDVVTYNYNTTYVYGTLEVTPKPCTINLNKELVKEYDGSVYTIANANAFNGVALPDGITADNFKIIYNSEIKNAGNYYYTAEYIGNNGNYTFNINSGNVTVTKKTVTLAYNGTGLSMTYAGMNSYYSDDANIINHLSVGIGTVTSAVLSKTLNSVAVNSVTVYNDGEDITSNLTINGKVTLDVTIEKCAFSLTLSPYSTSYYVKPEDLPSCVHASGLAVGDTLKITEEQIYNDGYSYYMVLDYDIVNSDGDSVKGYYAEPDLTAHGNITLIY